MSRLLGIFVLLVGVLFILAPPTQASAGIPSAQNTYQSPTSTRPSPIQSYQPQLGTGVSPNLGVLTQGILIETLAALSCQIAGIDPLASDGKCLAINPQTRELTRADRAGGGAIAFVTRGISHTYEIPVSSTQYIADLRGNFGITKSAFAQREEKSLGFRSLSPILEVWKAFRNLVFLFFVLIFSALGIGIMFRLHVDARAVMTVQNQIPKLVIGLILISFSYAIAGFMIDAMYVLIYLFFNVAAQIYESMGMDPLNTPSLASSPLGFVNTLYSPQWSGNSAVNMTFVGNAIKGVINSGIMSVTYGASLSVGEIVGSLFEGILDSTIGSLFSMLMSPITIPISMIGGPVCSVLEHIPGISDIPGLGKLGDVPVLKHIPGIGGGGGAACDTVDFVKNLPKLIIQSITSLVAFLVILIAILFSLFRLWFTLIKAYLFILLDVVFAPFWIAAGLLPHGGLGWWAWFRSVMANLSVFPVTIGVLLIGKIFMDAFGSSSGEYFVPPLIGNHNDPNEIGMLIGLGMILLTPQLIDTVKTALKTKTPNFPAISGAIGVGRGVGGKPFKELKHEFFGKDAFNNPRVGTAFIGNKLGRWAGAMTGGSFEADKYDRNLKGVGLRARLGSLIKPNTKNPVGTSRGEKLKKEKEIAERRALENNRRAHAGLPALKKDETFDGEHDDDDPPTDSGGGTPSTPPGGGSGSGGLLRKIGKIVAVGGATAVGGPVAGYGVKKALDGKGGKPGSTDTVDTGTPTVIPDNTIDPASVADPHATPPQATDSEGNPLGDGAVVEAVQELGETVEEGLAGVREAVTDQKITVTTEGEAHAAGEATGRGIPTHELGTDVIDAIARTPGEDRDEGTS